MTASIACLLVGVLSILYAILVLTNVSGWGARIYEWSTRIPVGGKLIRDDGQWFFRVGSFVGGSVLGVGLIFTAAKIGL